MHLQFGHITMYVGEGAKVHVPKLSEVTHSGIRQVPDKGARVGKGLGKRLQGKLRLITVIQKKIGRAHV